MNRTQLFKKIRGLSPSKLREVSRDQSCLAYFGAEPANRAHERVLFSSGFRKGVKAALRDERGVERADARKARGRHGDAAWALGFARGVKYTPDVDLGLLDSATNEAIALAKLKLAPKVKLKPIGNEFVHFDASQLSKSDLRRLKKRGRA